MEFLPFATRKRRRGTNGDTDRLHVGLDFDASYKSGGPKGWKGWTLVVAALVGAGALVRMLVKLFSELVQ